MSEAGTPTYPVTTIAKLLLLTDRRVQQLSAEGVIPRAERGRYELAPAVQGYIRYLQERHLGKEGETGEEGESTIAAEKLRKLKADADMAEMDRDKQAGVLQDEGAVVKAYAGRIVAARAKMLGIPKNLSPQLVGMEDPAEIETLIKAEVYAALRELGSTAQSATNGTPGEPSNASPAGAIGGSDGEGGPTVPGEGGPAVDAPAGVDGQPVG
jgi:hypothetical protein